MREDFGRINKTMDREQEEDGDEIERRNQLLQQGGGDDDRFVWDDSSQLYYHARSGFYHDPNGGWYYNTNDALYYKFEDGNYVLFDANYKDNPTETYGEESGLVNFGLEDSSMQAYNDEVAGDSSVRGGTEDVVDCSRGLTECATNDVREEEGPTPTSEWLEDTLIELYLSGYSCTAPRVADDEVNLFLERDGERGDDTIRSLGNCGGHEREKGEWEYGDHVAVDADGNNLSEDTSWEEENWKAQYGQVIHQEKEPSTDISVVDLWDWALVEETKKDGNGQVTRLVGRLVQPATKLHPSMPTTGGRLKTAPICQVHLDLVRVKSGQVYKLRSPSVGYLATLSVYDSSNPTKEWGFPELSVGKKRTSASEISDCRESKIACQVPELATRGHEYRDRAAERRALHGGFGIGLGQKRPFSDDDPSSPTSVSREEAAAEALDMSFGTGSFAQRMLKNMGWKEGEALGKSRQGLKKPLQAIGNKGSAGLGYPKGLMMGP